MCDLFYCLYPRYLQIAVISAMIRTRVGVGLLIQTIICFRFLVNTLVHCKYALGINYPKLLLVSAAKPPTKKKLHIWYRFGHHREIVVVLGL